MEGLDLSEAMIVQARRISKELNYNITFRVGDAACLDYDDETFNAALFSFNGWDNADTGKKKLDKSA